MEDFSLYILLYFLNVKLYEYIADWKAGGPHSGKTEHVCTFKLLYQWWWIYAGFSFHTVPICSSLGKGVSLAIRLVKGNHDFLSI